MKRSRSSGIAQSALGCTATPIRLRAFVYMAILMAFGACTCAHAAGTYSGGSGTAEDPHQIATKADLLELAANTDDYDKCFILTADIDLAGETFTTAVIAPDTDSSTSGFQGTEFTGSFDGSGHVVRNLSIDTNGVGNDYLGLFGRLGKGASLANLGVAGLSISGSSGSHRVGGICGQNDYGTLSQCYATGSVTGDDYVGGLCGYSYFGALSQCYATGSATGDYYVGGLCGYESFGALSGCYATGDVTGESGYVGGLCGCAFSSTVSGCFATGTATGESDYVGGLCGHNQSSTVSGCYATGDVTGESGCVGGLCGYTSGTLSECYATGATTGHSSVGGLFGAVGFATVSECYATGSATGNSYVGGLFGSVAYATVNECYATGSATGNSYVGGLCGHKNDGTLENCYFHLFGGPDNGFGTPLESDELVEASSFAGFDFVGSSADGTDDVWDITAGHCPRLNWETGDGPEPPPAALNTTLSGSGTSSDPFVIASVADFTEFLTNEALVCGYYSLTCDIDLADKSFAAAPVDRTFGGTFLGNGHVVRNLTIDTEGASTDYLGLFAFVCGTVCDLGVEDFSITGGSDSDYVGGLSGYCYYGALSGCCATGSAAGDDHIGGLCGYTYYGTVSECYATGSVAGGDYVGGLCGEYHYGTVNECYATASATGGDYVGGFCGKDYYGTVSECHATGSATGGDYVGGFCGTNDHGTVGNCYATGATAGSGSVGGFCGYELSGGLSGCYATGAATGDSDYVGGLCGYTSGTVSDCYATGAATGDARVGGLCGYTHDGTLSKCYATGLATGDSYVGGLCGYKSGGTVENCYFYLFGGPDNGFGTPLESKELAEASSFAGFDFVGSSADGADEVWSIAEGYCPRLSWESGIGFEPPLAELSTTLSGSGTSSDPYVLASAADFTEFLTNDALVYGCYSLSCDIDLADESFAAAPVDRTFGGTFLGNGHVVRNLTIDTEGASTSCLGLFASVCGTVRDLGVEDFSITGGSDSDYVGGLCGYADHGTMSGCYATGSAAGEDYVGGLCGYVHYGTVSECYATGSAAGDYHVGGLCGYNFYGTVSQCYAAGAATGGYSVGGLCGRNHHGTVSDCCATGSATGDDYVGGLCGDNSYGTVSDCYATGSTTGDDYVGGFCGYRVAGTVTNCHSVGSVTGGAGATNVGGFCGAASGNACAGCFWDTETSGMSTSPGGVTGKTTAEMQTQSTFTDAGWDFVGETANGTDGTWYMDGYPALNHFNSAETYALTVTNGTGGGSYASGTLVTVTADAPAQGQEFVGWTVSPTTYADNLADATATSTTFTMPGTTAILTATYAAYAPYGGGSGTEDDPYQITKKADLLELAGNTDDYDKHFILTADIDLTGETFTTAVIASAILTSEGSLYGTSFTGTFDGRARVIRNMSIDYPIAGCLGLFGHLGSGARVSNLGIQDIQVTCGSGSEYVGGLCGYNASGDIGNCYVSGTISVGYLSSTVGGLCGHNEGGTIHNSYATVAVAGDLFSECFGGLCGQNSGSIAASHATGDVTVQKIGGYLGGLCGRNTGTIEDCYATGAVAGGRSSDYLGGLCGAHATGFVSGSYATGSVAGDAYATYVGGLCGSSDEGTIEDCMASGAVSVGEDSDCVGGLCGSVSYGAARRCSATGDVTAGSDCSAVGGLCGSGYSSGVSECYATGDVTTGDDSRRIGGLCGRSGYGADVKNSYATGDVTTGTRSSSIGGLCGYDEYGTVDHCYAIGVVVADGYSSSVGGLCGGGTADLAGANYFYFMAGPDNAMGEPLGPGELQDAASFAGLDFAGSTEDGTEDIWAIEPGHCPRLVWQTDEGPLSPSQPTLILSGSGTATDPFVISSEAEFAEFRNNPRLSGGHYSLTCDIDLGDEAFSGAAIDRLFWGVFEGNGHVVRDLTIDTADTSADRLGLFGSVYGGTIRSLGVESAHVNGSTVDYVGALCGFLNSGTLSDCYTTGAVVGNNNVGGLCGYSSSSTIENCHTATLTTGGSYIGGLCGYNSSGTIEKCYATAATTGYNDIGGLCGHNSSGTIGNCYATAAATGNYRIGGLCGTSDFGTIGNCYATGTATGINSIGGLCGSGSGTLVACYAIGAVRGGDQSRFVDGLCGYSPSGGLDHCYFHLLGGPANGFGEPLDATQLKDAASFAGFDFAGPSDDGTNEIWTITAGHCPRLTWQEGDGPLPPTGPTTSLAGSGTATDPFLIANAGNLMEFCDNNGLSGGYYSLVCDVDLAGTTFDRAPISRLFGGVFNGNGHVVRNLTIDTGGIATDYLGLFFSTSGTVQELGLEGVQITCAGSSYVGGLCGRNYGTLTGCWTSGSITTGDTSRYLGGLCGYNDYGLLDNCYTSSTVAASDGSRYVGGLCGFSYGTVTGCHTTGPVTSGDSSAFLGGLCGYSDGTIDSCHATGLVTAGASSGSIGGLCGYSGSGVMKHCYATGAITGGNSSSSFGGFCGSSNLAEMERCYATGAITVGYSSRNIGGFCGEIRRGRIANCYSHSSLTFGGYSTDSARFVGQSSYSTLEHCYAAGAVNFSTTLFYVGGLYGYGFADATSGCFWDTAVSDDSRYGSTGLSTAEMQTQSTFTDAGWDFVGETANGTEDIWYMKGYPLFAAYASAPIHVLGVHNGSGSGSYEVGTTVSVAADVPPEGQEFVGWTIAPAAYAANLGDASSTDTTFTVPDADVTVTATYVTKTYTVLLDLGEHGAWTGGGKLAQAVLHGGGAVAPDFAIEEGWEFKGWSEDFSVVTSDLTVTALYRVVDTDSDYLGDLWENQHFGDLDHGRKDDPDGDGFSNWEEYVVDTDPNDPLSYPQHYPTLVWEDAVHKLRAIGEALERYMDDHGPDVLPGRLMYLVDEGYLDADMLLAIGDESGGTDPHRYDGDMYADVYENGVSFFYETSESLCPWTLPSLGFDPDRTWYDVKMYQLAYGRGDGQAYDRRAFPIVRFFWPTDYTQLGLVGRVHWTSVSLAMDCHTVFASSFEWEQQSDAYLPDDPMVLRPLLETPLIAQYGVSLNFPLWFALRDVSDTYGLRLVPSGDARDGEAIGEIQGHYYTVTPGIDTPTAFTVTVEWDDETGAVQQASFDVALDSGPDDDPDGDGLDNTAELAAGTDPYDPESYLTVSFVSAASSVPESVGSTTIRCQLSGTSTLPVTVDYAVPGGTATGGGVDYTLTAGTLVFAAGESEKELELTIVDDALPEFDETVQIELSAPEHAVLGTNPTHTTTILDDDSHTVTFDLGAHGTWTGGGELIQRVADGTAAIRPRFAVDAGWRFTGWDKCFRNITADLSVVANYKLLPPLWELDVMIDGDSPAILTIGMALGATDGWDEGLDVQCPTQEEGQACLSSDDLSVCYSADYRAIASEAEFLLTVSASAEASMTLSWNNSDLPAGKLMSLYQVAPSDASPCRDGVPWEPVGNTGTNMDLTSSVTVPAGQTRCYVIRYGDELVFDLAFEAGWNLVSLPIEPTDPALDIVLSDGSQGTINSGDVCRWTGQEYVVADELHACIGYWIYVADAEVILVEGVPVGQTQLDLARGWGLCGVEAECDVPADSRIVGTPWIWNAASLRYETTHAFRPGVGFWITVSEDAQIRLDGN